MNRVERLCASTGFRAGHLGLGVLVVVAYMAAAPGSVRQAALEVGLHATVAPLILLGVWLHRPSRPAGWYVIAASQVFYAVGNVLGTWWPAVTGMERPFPAPADVFYLLAYVVMFAGVATILVHRTRGLGPGALLDMATVSVGLSSLAWVFMLEPMLPSTSGAATVAIVAYVLVDVALVAVLVHMGLARGARSPAMMLLAAAVGAQLAGDALYTLGSVHGTFTAGAPAFVCWMTFYVLLGATALRPSMSRLAEPDGTVTGLSPRGRILLLSAAALLPPATLFVHVADRHVSVLAGITMATFTGVLLRLVKLQDELQETSRVQQLKDQLLSIVSHEIRTPLTVVNGSLATLRRGVAGELTPGQDTMVAMAANHTDRLIRLVTDLLDVQRSSFRPAELQTRPISLGEVVDQVTTSLSEHARERGVVLRHEVGELTVQADPERLHQVVSNLVENAVKFSRPGGQVEITAHRRHRECLIRVSDRGRGIPVDMHEKIFLPFQQVDASDSREHNGTGLGLAICRSVIEQHGGRIWVESTPPNGATFLFTLPLGLTPAAPPAGTEPALTAR